MSTKIGIIAEGPIDHCLLPPLLGRIARERADYGWPVTSDDVAEVFSIRKRGHGGVLETVRRLVKALDAIDDQRAFYVILLDRRTKAVQEEIKKLLENRDRFVLGIAIEEIEAWWLGDPENTLAWVTNFLKGGAGACGSTSPTGSPFTLALNSSRKRATDGS